MLKQHGWKEILYIVTLGCAKMLKFSGKFI